MKILDLRTSLYALSASCLRWSIGPDDVEACPSIADEIESLGC